MTMEYPMNYLKQSKHVEFQDVYYTVTERKNLVQVTGIRQILRGVSGSFRNGQLSAIMGPSGAGKSSLLNAISGFRTSGVSGHIHIERKNSCYITQEDNHQTLLSVEELMNLSCDLKLNTSRHKKQEIINDILENLNLNHRRNVVAEKLSGGERKRLSIALELVADPNILFLDEPTSGLDEVTASQCISLLRRLAKQGRTIVCTVHQPSARIFNCFDNIFILAKGQCVYQGPPDGLIPFLRYVELECPVYYSPPDYIMELCDCDDDKLIPMFSELTDNGKLVYKPQVVQQMSGDTLEADLLINNDGHAASGNGSCNVAGFVKTESYNKAMDEREYNEFQNALTSFFVEQPRRNTIMALFSTNTVSTDGTLVGGATALFEHMKAFSKRMYSETQEISAFRQFYVLLRVMMLKIMRAKIALLIQLLHHLLCGMCIGLIFLKSADKGERMFDHLKFCICSILVVVYTQVMVPILSFPSEVKIVKKETFNRWYTLTPYYLALNISRLPLHLLMNALFISLIYWMSGLPNQWWRFGMFAAVAQVTSIAAEGMGLFIGATFSITNGSAVGPLVIAPFMGLAVYGFDFAAQIPAAMNLLMKFSFIRVGVVSLVLTVFGFHRPELDCNDIYCHFGDPRVLLKFLDIEKVSILTQFEILAAIGLFFRCLLYLSLRRRCCT